MAALRQHLPRVAGVWTGSKRIMAEQPRGEQFYDISEHTTGAYMERGVSFRVSLTFKTFIIPSEH
jgi:hypothetical protein